MRPRSTPVLLFVLSCAPSAAAQDPAEPMEEVTKDLTAGDTFEDDLGIEWTVAPAELALGSHSRVQVSAGCTFTDGEGAKVQLMAWGNPPGDPLGMIQSLDPANGWAAIFRFDACGYVKDDEKDDLDAEELLEVHKESQEAANEERESRGFEPLEVVGWAVPPHYDEATNNLESGLILRGRDGGETVNYEVKLLGRHGVMEATLLCGPEQLEASLPEFREVIAGHAFESGNTYAEYTQGDPVAEFGLTALVVGGAAAVLWKTGILGILAKYAKFIVLAVVAGFAGVWKFLTGRRKEAAS